MKITVSSTVLSVALQKAGRLIGSKSLVPLHDSFRLSVVGAELTVVGSDMENTIVVTIPLISSEGDICFCVPARTLTNAVKEIPEQPLTLDFNLETLMVGGLYQNGYFEIMGQNGDLYPMPKTDIEESKNIAIPAKTLSDGLTRTIFALSNTDLRPVMNAVCIDMSPQGLVFVATDGHKLVRYTHTKVTHSELSTMVLPQKPALLLKNIIDKDKDGDIMVTYNSMRAQFVMNGTVLYCRLTDSRYPNYNAVIPTNNPYVLTVDRSLLLAALRRVILFANPASALIKIGVSNGQMLLTAQDLETSLKAEETVPCDYQGELLTMGFKGPFLIDVVGNLYGDRIVMRLADPSRAGIIEPEQKEEGEELLMMQMPMMLNDM